MLVKPSHLAAICFLLGFFLFAFRGRKLASDSNAKTLSASGSSKPRRSKACTWTFVGYNSSVWEDDWLRNIDAWQFSVSSQLHKPESQENCVRLVKSVASIAAGEALMNFAADAVLFSSFHYERRCPSGVKEFGTQLIEPMIGMLRDPLLLNSISMPELPLNGVDAAQSKRNLMPAAFAPYKTSTTPVFGEDWNFIGPAPWISRPSGRAILFDLGSSYFGSWVGNAAAEGTKWFVRHFHSRGVVFERIFAFEYSKLDPYTLWDEIPPELMSIYTPINHGVESATDSKYNPWNLLMSIAVEIDFVVVKLDIDTAPIENDLMEQLLASPKLKSLIDEMFFEHHTNVPEMSGYWGSSKDMKSLSDSYRWFNELRRAGVRMHSWP